LHPNVSTEGLKLKFQPENNLAQINEDNSIELKDKPENDPDYFGHPNVIQSDNDQEEDLRKPVRAIVLMKKCQKVPMKKKSEKNQSFVYFED
jgi:hypothetical protein